MLTNLTNHFRKNLSGFFSAASDKFLRRAETPSSPEPGRSLGQAAELSPTSGEVSSPLADCLRSLLALQNRNRRTPVVLCIGTDRIIGDSLGPLVGSKLTETGLLPYVYGTLDTPVHALNLRDTLDEIKKKHPSSTVIAVDASLGSKSGIGSISVRDGGLYPGAGVSKNLCLTGDISITGITNMEDGCPLLSLQTARLSTVMQMAEQIAECILEACAS